MFAKLFKMAVSFSASIWLDDSIVCARLTKELH